MAGSAPPRPMLTYADVCRRMLTYAVSPAIIAMAGSAPTRPRALIHCPQFLYARCLVVSTFSWAVSNLMYNKTNFVEPLAGESVFLRQGIGVSSVDAVEV